VNRIRQFLEAWKQLRQLDPKALPLVFAGVLVGLLVGSLVGFLLAIWAAVLFGLLGAGLGGLFMFSRRMQKAQLTAIEGHPGAAAAVLNQMRGQWFVTAGVAFNNKQDLVHRVVGRPGVVLVGEGGSAQRVKGLLAKERKRLKRVLGDTPLYTVVVGDGEGQVPLKKLQLHFNKLKRELSKSEVPKLERKLKPLDAANLPIPKGVDPNQIRGPRPRPR
jgi:hypothetical protein